MFDLGETNRGWSFSTGYVKSFRRNGATLLPIRFRPKHSRRNVLCVKHFTNGPVSVVHAMTSKYTNFRSRGWGESQRKRERERGGWKRDERELLTIFSSINSLSITIERVCPSVNATIMRWSVSVRLPILSWLFFAHPLSRVSTLFCLSSSIHARAIITDR